MAASVNRVFLLGNIGKDPELLFTPHGKNYTRLALATNENWTDGNGQRQERVQWFQCEVWGKQAENCCQYLKKGSQVFIEGSLRTEKYTDKGGIERYLTKVMVRSVKFLDRRPQGQPTEEEWEPGQDDF